MTEQKTFRVTVVFRVTADGRWDAEGKVESLIKDGASWAITNVSPCDKGEG